VNDPFKHPNIPDEMSKENPPALYGSVSEPMGKNPNELEL